jgi:hypothetical protein
MATMTPKSTYTAKGSIAAATGASTPANLAVGNNGETLVADSSTSTGLRYTSNFAAGKNAIINGAMYWSQRGTTFTNPANGAYTLDRWRQYQDGTVSQVISQQTFTPGTAPVAGYEGTYFLRKAVASASGGAYNNLEQAIEDVRTFAGQTVTMSFWAKADASRSLTPILVQNFGSGGSGAVTVTGTTITLTTSWVRYTQTLNLASISGKTIGTSSQLVYTFNLPVSGAFTIDIWGAQLEAGSVASAFQTATGTIQGELAACQRYFTVTTQTFDGLLGQCAGTTAPRIGFPLPISMRVSPSASLRSGTPQIRAALSQASQNATSPSLQVADGNMAVLQFSIATPLTLGALVTYQANSAIIDFSAEL